MTVPDEMSGMIVFCPDAGHLAWIGDDRIFESVLPRLGSSHFPGEFHWDSWLVVVIEEQSLSIHNFEHDLVNVDGVCICCEIVEFPYLRITDVRGFGNRIGPHLIYRHTGGVD